MKIKTRNINQAAFFLATGGRLIEITDHYPNNLFVVETNKFWKWYEKHIGFVSYRKLCNQRVRLKERGRKLANLPERFSGRKEGYKFGDIATVRQFTHRELTN